MVPGKREFRSDLLQSSVYPSGDRLVCLILQITNIVGPTASRKRFPTGIFFSFFGEPETAVALLLRAFFFA